MPSVEYKKRGNIGNQRNGWIAMLNIVALTFATSCTKKSERSSQGAPERPNLSESPQAPAPQPADQPETQYRYALASVAGDAVFCQEFISKTPAASSALEALTESMARAQGQIPSGVTNPFTPKTMGLAVRESACSGIPSLLKDGHCAVTAVSDSPAGRIPLQTEQRILWKDLPLLAQASYINATIESKNSAIAGKNDLFKSIQKQITQQQQVLQILQLGQTITTGEQSKLLEQAREVLKSLESQAQQIETDVGKIEADIVPFQDELNKTITKLGEARSSLKQSCTSAGMGAAAAEWKEN